MIIFSNKTNPQAVALEYKQHNVTVIPVPYKKKVPVISEWQNYAANEDIIKKDFKDEKQNIGLLLGSKSDNLVDIDLDCPEALALAKILLPKTATFGRKSTPQSHWIYKLSEATDRVAFTDPTNKEMLVELRGNKCQTIIPPSVHPSGEKLSWVKEGQPTETSSEELEKLCRVLASISLLARYWPCEGSRQNAALGLSGVLAKNGLSEDTTRAIIEHICEFAGDLDEISMRVGAVHSTYKAMSSNGRVAGFNKLKDAFDDVIVDKLKEWLDVRGKKEAKSAKEQMIASTNHLEFWHTANDTTYVTLTEKGHKENLLLKGERFHKWLINLMRKEHGKMPPKQAVDEALGALEAQASLDGKEYEVFYRVCSYNGNLYIDRGTEDWSVIEVRPDGWDIISESPVRFIRSDSLKALPTPDRNGNIMLLKDYMQCNTEDDFKLIIGLILGIFAPRHPYPLGIFTGTAGSGKSTRAKIVSKLTDPSSAPLVNPPSDGLDAVASVSARWVTIFDNVKSISSNISDTLCRISTGSAHSARKLFTNLSVFETLEISRPVMITAIELRLRQDLRSRSIVFAFPPFRASECKTEEDIEEAYNIDAPKIFGGILDTISCALRNKKKTAALLRGKEMPRMADHTVWVSAAEEALGWKPETYRKLLLEHQRDGMAESDMNSILGQAVLGYLKQKAEGGQNPLIYQVRDFYFGIKFWAEKELGKDERKYIPHSPAAFSKKIRLSAQSLEYYGVKIEFDVNHGGNKRAIRITFSKEFLEGIINSPF